MKKEAQTEAIPNTSLEDIRRIISEFDNDFDDPFTALQDIADILGIDKKIDESDDDDDDDDEDEDDDIFDDDDD
jgi:hypothetical protein